MGNTATARDNRLFVRCKSREKELIERAAAALGMSVSDYIRSAAIERAANEIHRHNRILITQQAFAQLDELMETDPEPSPALTANAVRYRRLVDSGRVSVED